MNLFQRYKKYLAGKLLLFLSLLFSTFCSIAQNNNVQLTGKVVDDRTKEPLTGAVVHIKGTTHHVVADEEGAFTFVTGQKIPVVYEVSHVGYETREITVSDYKPVDIRLKPGNAQLSDVVVVGYGTQRRSDVS